MPENIYRQFSTERLRLTLDSKANQKLIQVLHEARRKPKHSLDGDDLDDTTRPLINTLEGKLLSADHFAALLEDYLEDLKVWNLEPEAKTKLLEILWNSGVAPSPTTA
ncbi:MAG TPA: hypothetical protein VNG90_00350 [Candidatus Acidoferrum sp.]|nr:hypothetical protein [Candidatus Acidoferrum sp.]